MEVVTVDQEEEEFVQTKRTRTQKFSKITKIFLIDIILILLFSIPFLVFYGWRQKIGFKTGFFCNDNSLRYPYVVSKISQGNIAAQTLLAPPIILAISEIIKRFKKTKYLGKIIYLRIVRFLHGFCICMSFSYVPKLFRGNLRPHFMDVCIPNINCSAIENQFILIQDYECQNKDVTIDVYMSFPSVHTSSAVFVSIYLIFFIWKRVKWFKIRICLQFFMLLYAFFISISRINEHYHHPSDVIAGTIIGGLSAYASVKYFEDFFRDTNKDILHKSI